MAKLFVVFEIVIDSIGRSRRFNDEIEYSREPADLKDVRAIEARIATLHQVDPRIESVVLLSATKFARSARSSE